MSVVGLICARGGSKGLPGKNVKLLGGRPLLMHSVDLAKKVKRIDKLIVSTDSQEIAEIAISGGATVPYLRPKELAEDSTPEWLVWKNILTYLHLENQFPKALVVLSPTAPLRNLDDVTGAIELFFNNNCDGVLCATDANRNPFFNMISVDNNGLCKTAMEGKKIFRRQDAKKFFDVTTVCYVVDPKFVLEQSHLLDGKILMHYVPPERSIDIDNQLDFEIAEFLFNRDKSN